MQTEKECGWLTAGMTPVGPTDAERKAARVLQYRFEPMRQRLIDAGSVEADKYDATFTEYLKWVYVAATAPAPVGMFSKPVDAIFHQHHLFSREYMRFCDNYFGTFIHHDPAPYPGVVDPVECKKGFERFKELYEAQFGALHTMWS